MKFKVGDKVKIISNNSGSCNNIGDIGIIFKIQFDSISVNCGNCEPGIGDWSIKLELELIEEEYKVGDVVLVETNRKWIIKIIKIEGAKIHYDRLSDEENPKTAEIYRGWTDWMDTYLENTKKLTEPIQHFKYKNPKYFPCDRQIVSTPRCGKTTWVQEMIKYRYEPHEELMKKYMGAWGVDPQEQTNHFFEQYLNNKPKERNNFMRKLSELTQKVRRAFSPDQKALWKAGYIDDCNAWTDKAVSAVDEMMCEEKKEKLVELANEEIQLAKDEKKEDN